ncbi:hypothetical protein VTN96DRAFT_4233 [Rasamsonia emersonii]
MQSKEVAWVRESERNRMVFAKKNRNIHRQGCLAQTAFLLHIISFVASNSADQPTLHISHLCDQCQCFNPDHLVAESGQTNNSRKGCPRPMTCFIESNIVCHGSIITDFVRCKEDMALSLETWKSGHRRKLDRQGIYSGNSNALGYRQRWHTVFPCIPISYHP